MRLLRKLGMQLRALLRADAVDRDLGDEMRGHFDRLIEEHLARGMTPAAARAVARREFGPMTQLVEESRDARGVSWIANTVQDLRYATRLIALAPGLSTAAILTIVLGIGATTAMFSVVYGVLLQPLPYGQPERLVSLWSTAVKRGLPRAYVGMANVYDWRARNHVFEDIAAVRAIRNFNLTGDASPIGRRFHPPMPARVMPDHGWYTIVGVVGHIRHERLEDDGRPQLYWSYKQFPQDRQALVVRTQGDPAALAASIAAAIRSVDPEQPVYDARRLEEVVDRSLAQRCLQTAVLAAFAAIALLLASIGVYGVIAYTVGQRRREFGIRMALGAGRRDVIALVLQRGGALFACGAAVGLVAAGITARLLGTLLFNVKPFDPVSFAAATVVLLTVSLAACSLPARRAARVDPAVTLRTE